MGDILRSDKGDLKVLVLVAFVFPDTFGEPRERLNKSGITVANFMICYKNKLVA